MKKALALAVVVALAPLAVRAQAPYLVKDINTIATEFPTGSYPSGFIKFGSRIYFGTRTDPGTQLWSTDGSASDTTRVATIGTASLMPSRFVVVNGKLLFN